MPGTGGPQVWPGQGGVPLLREGFWLGGQYWHGQMRILPAIDVGGLGGPTLLRTVGGGTIEQNRWLAGNAPVNLRPLTLSLDLQMVDSDDYVAVIDLLTSGVAQQVWFDLPIIDRWLVAGNTSQEFGEEFLHSWQPCRPFPWDLPGIDATIRPATVQKQGSIGGAWTTLTPTTSLPPSVGEVWIEGVGGYRSIVTNAAESGAAWYRLIYHPLMYMAATSGSLSYQDFNDLRIGVELEEVLAVDFNQGVGD